MTRGIAATAAPSSRGLVQRGDDVQVERLADRARLLGAVEHGDRLDAWPAARRRSRSTVNGRYSRTLSTPTFSPRAISAVDRLVRRLGAGAHQHDHALGVGCAVVVEQVVLRGRSARRSGPSPPARCRAGGVERVDAPRGPGRRRRGSAPCRAGPDGRATARARGGRDQRRRRSSRAGRRRRAARSSSTSCEVRKPSKKCRNGTRDSQRGGLGDQREVLRLLHRARGRACAKPVGAARPSRRGDRRRSTARAWRAARAATWKTAGVSSPAILYMLGIISSRPCDAVNVVASAPACSAPCTAPAAPPSLCISTTAGTVPQRFGRPAAAHCVGQLAHRRGGRDRVDRDHLAQRDRRREAAASLPSTRDPRAALMGDLLQGDYRPELPRARRRRAVSRRSRGHPQGWQPFRYKGDRQNEESQEGHAGSGSGETATATLPARPPHRGSPRGRAGRAPRSPPSPGGRER